MISKNKGLVLYQRLLFWALYIFSGFILYSQKGNFHNFLIYFARVMYPLSIFWLQIRIKKREKFLPIDSSMSTSQLWFKILPVIASLIAVIVSLSNAFLFTLEKLILN